MKTCSKCGILKDETYFTIRRPSRQQRERGQTWQSWYPLCKECEYEKNRKYFKERYYPENRDRLIKKTVKNREKRLEKFH